MENIKLLHSYLSDIFPRTRTNGLFGNRAEITAGVPLDSYIFSFISK